LRRRPDEAHAGAIGPVVDLPGGGEERGRALSGEVLGRTVRAGQHAQRPRVAQRRQQVGDVERALRFSVRPIGSRSPPASPVVEAAKPPSRNVARLPSAEVTSMPPAIASSRAGPARRTARRRAQPRHRPR